MPRIKLKKIDEAIYEIPKTGRMRVPVRIYATEPLLKKMYEDRTFIQASNVATLPGIYKYSILLADSHEGYGFSIGNVAAFDAEDGIISPGGVGYDINCLPGDSRVLSPLGYYVFLRDVSLCSDVVTVSNIPVASKVIFCFKRYEDNILVIRTRSGYVLRATYDHPLLTKRGMVEAGKLNKGDSVALFPFIGQPYERPPDNVLLNERFFNPRIASELKRRRLVPLRASSDKFPLLVRILGYFFGNGSFNGKQVWFYGSPEGLEEIRCDIFKLGYSPSRIYRRVRRSGVQKEFFDGEYSFFVSARSFRELLTALGAPADKKIFQDYVVPKWLFDMPRWVKRLFLAGFFGAKLEAPHSFNGYNFSDLDITIIKHVNHEDSGVVFLLGIKRLLADLGVKANDIYKFKCGDKILLRLPISSKPENLVKLWTTVGYDYNPRRRYLALAAAAYLNYKLQVKQYRGEVMLQTIGVHSFGASLPSIINGLSGTYTEGRYVEENIYRERKGGMSSNILKFQEWLDGHFDGVRVWDEIVSIEKVQYGDYVYDITVDHEEHNFIADGFVVSNCGVRLMTTSLSVEDVRPKVKELVDTIFYLVPSGLGSRRKDFRVSRGELDEICRLGARYIVEHFGLGFEEDLEFIEEEGCYPGADPRVVSARAKDRGLPQVGTLGSGNHFLEIQVVNKIYDPNVAKVFGINHVGQVTIMVHTGSRGFGHQVCSDYIRVMERASRRHNIFLPDRELAAAPAKSREAEDYLRAFACAVNYAFANRQAISHWTREAFIKVFKRDVDALGIKVLYDIAHNIVKFEEHRVDSVKRKVYVHRKGATRSLPAGHPLVPKTYRGVGQPVLIPGSMGTASYILVGMPSALERSFGSAAHGSGRMMSRAAAKRAFRAEQVLKELGQRGILVRADSMATISEEVDAAYKDPDEIAYATEKAGLAKRVARLLPLAVVKG